VPVYEYICCECEKIFEAIHSMHNRLPEIIDECPCCKKKNCQIKKLISLTNFRVTGPPKNPERRTGYVNFGSAKTYDCKDPRIINAYEPKDTQKSDASDTCSDCPDL